MATPNKPAGMTTLCPYFLVADADKFLSFLKDIFEAQESGVYRDDDGRIMHAEVRIDDSVIMFSNSTDLYPPLTCGVFIYVTGTDEVYNKALAAGATSEQAPEDKDYGRSAGIKDPFGNVWWLTQL
ncbi:VOC family protein [Chitinophaga barathri]|uniref:VOC family protein n=1 Tax=Chitinophaga barathri TaxID=1647451 RepID=A0A3N4M7R9_9BACT|nr:VOC family protein [Chitinophaga barathri]RPD39285.1 VOC family protein [Chitinophaga barathri]